MLVLSRKIGEQLIIGDDISVTVAAICGNQVRLGILAPPDVRILRTELCTPEASGSGSPDRSGEPTPS
jgi:carbon storage regulator CsrA